MSLEAEINAYFVKTRSGEVESEDFKSAATLLSSHVSEHNIRHIKSGEGYPLIASGQLTKRDVFIFDHFEGDFFKQLQQTKALIVGPRCLLVCLLNNQPIPFGQSPVYTTAMRDLKISASGITPQEKEKISKQIQWMGGYYLQNFGRSVTHLISNTIKSSKYEHASLNGIPVMHMDWVQRVWERSLVDYISATDEEFEKYRLPIFFDAKITSTGLDTAKKDEVMRLVQENGGTYHRTFRSQTIDIVITEKGKTESEKYKAAQRLKKDILTIEWIFDSVKSGFALPTKNYQVKSLKVSTPTKPDQSLADFTSTDHTQLSEISRIVAAKPYDEHTIDDTICGHQNDSQRKSKDATFQAPAPPPIVVAARNSAAHSLQRDVLMKNADSSGANYRNILEEISPREAKKAGNFLDGCCIFLSGFRAAEKEKLNRILNVGGATRYDAINDEITHVIVGQISDADYKAWKKDGLRAAAHIVRLDWLLESIKLKQTANENNFRVSLPNSSEPDAPSPSSKKTLRSMNHSFKQPDLPTKKKLFSNENDKSNCNVTSERIGVPRACSTELPMEEDEHELLQQYSQENMALPVPVLPTAATTPISSTKTNNKSQKAADVTAAPASAGGNNTEMTACSIDYEKLDVFKNLIIYVDRASFTEEMYTQMMHECDAAHANVVQENFQDPVDYAIVTFERTIDVARLPVKANFVVTELYMESCMKENKLVPIEYFHRPIPHTADSQPLQDMKIVISVYADFEREYIDSLAKLLGATVNETYSKKEQPLLICPESKGAKYLGALKWGFPVVTSDWLVKCAEMGSKLPLESYLVGESAAEFPSPRSARTSYMEDVANIVQQPPAAATKDITPLRNKRVAELVATTTPVAANAAGSSKTSPSTSNCGDSPRTPANAYGRATYKFEFMEKILDDIEDAADREFIRELIEDIRANPTPELERIKRQVCTPANRQYSIQKAIPDFCSTPEFKRRMAEALDKRWYLPTKKLKPSTPIDQIRKRVIKATCRDLGIPVSSDEEETEHVVAEKVPNENSTPASSNRRNAEKQKTAAFMTPVQHRNSTHSRAEPRTIFAMATPNAQRPSLAAGDKSYVPNTQDVVQQAVPSVSSPRNSAAARPSLAGKTTIDFDKISFEETTVNSLRKSVTAHASPELKQITDYLRERENKRQSTSTAGASATNVQQQPAPVVPMETEPQFLQPFESEQLCADSEQMVAWRDPIEFNIEKRALKVRTMQYQGTPRFSISCGEDARDSIIEKIQKLGGEISTVPNNFDPECTHFVCERPNRGEKILGCISAGKWVLSLKYIEESFAKDNFVDEELYEWGNPKAINLPSISSEEYQVGQAAYRWRLELSCAADTPETGIFTNFRAILRIIPKSQAPLGNVIRAGNGLVITATPPFRNCPDVSSATHCFVDMKKMPLNREDYEYLQSCGVKIASHLYIQAYILSGGIDANFSAYEIKL